MSKPDILELISMIKDKTGEVKAIVDDLQQLAEHMTEIAKIGKRILQRVEDIKAKK